MFGRKRADYDGPLEAARVNTISPLETRAIASNLLHDVHVTKGREAKFVEEVAAITGIAPLDLTIIMDGLGDYIKGHVWNGSPPDFEPTLQ